MIRFDRTITLIIYFFLKKIIYSKGKIPILMYHSISNKIEKGFSPYFITTTTPDSFKKQMQWLKENGYKGVSLDKVENYWNKNEKVVAITFDDGFEDFYTEAFPILKEYNFSATVFVPTAYVGSQGEKIFGGIPHLSWDIICQLSKQGIEFGSHTVHHSVLRYCSKEEIEKEIKDSKRCIEEKTGKTVLSFSYPCAFPFDDKKLVKFLEETTFSAGYKFAVSTRIGISQQKSHFYFMPRIPINNLDDRDLFLAKISGAYNWLNIVQYIYRHISILISPSKYKESKLKR